MVPAPSASFAWDYWVAPPDNVQLHCFLPNSLYIPIFVNRNATLHEVKEDLWEYAPKHPLYGMLRDMSKYSFQYINSLAVVDEEEDESKRLRDLKPYFGILRIIEHRYENDKDKLLNSQISQLIGKDLRDFDNLKNPEVNDFRQRMRSLTEEQAYHRRRANFIQRLCHKYPPRLANSPSLPQTLANRLRNNNFVLVSKFDNTETTFTFNVSYTITPQQLLKTILNKKANTMNTRGEHPSDFVLKVCGREEYLVGDHPLVQFLYVQETLSRDGVPTVITLPVDNIYTDRELYDIPSLIENKGRPSFSTLRKKSRHVSSWDIAKSYTCTVLAICKLNTDASRTFEVGIKAGIFHAGKSLCESQNTTTQIVNSGELTWNETITFQLEVVNIPRMARLCFVVYEVQKIKYTKKKANTKTNKETYTNPLAWVNTTIFDYKNHLKTGSMTLYMWPYTDEIQNEALLHPLGTVVANPNTDDCVSLTIECSNYDCDTSIVFPPDDVVREYGELYKCQYTSQGNILPLDLIQIEQGLNEKDPFYEIHEQEKEKLWSNAENIRDHHPHLLPRLLLCVEWANRALVARASSLVAQWPILSYTVALELLDYAYVDRHIRSFAVKCLKDISDEDLSLYLLQLVQALKHESYYMCDLVEFLLRRALANRRIGHYLFWHLRSEMRVSSVSVRFGLILETYCRACQEHLLSLSKQNLCLEKLKNVNDALSQRRDIQKARSYLTEFLAEPHAQEALSNVTSPLDPSYRCKQIRADKCRVMDSKMRPLWLVFENQDIYGSDICIILKNGDDLRQDMLTLQMLRIMDRLWKSEGYDFRMNPYGCIAMDHRIGMIEVVPNAETIANIQKTKNIFSATSPFMKGSLLRWLRDHNPVEDALNKAIEEFTLSCAGYCVATYVLGVADRHSDNIMIKKTGQLFHIDFGHILGHFKEKFGFRREWVPFVLTHDFVNVINKGQKDAKKEVLEFQIFQKHCETAFMILRKHGNLFLSLFAMMISTGLPELSSEKDIAYLRETLVLDKPEADALKHFRAKFEEALSNSWKTSLNWASHNIAKNNKQ